MAGVTSADYFQDFQRIRGAIELGGLACMKERGELNRNYDSITKGTHSLRVNVDSASSFVMTKLHCWYHVKFIARGPADNQKQVFENIIAANKFQHQRVIDALIATAISKAHMDYTSKELALFSQNS